MTLVSAPGSPTVEIDLFGSTQARRAPALLRMFNQAGILVAADVHVALRLGQLLGVDDEAALLATALAVRAPRLGHVCVDMATIRSSVIVDAEVPVDAQALPWPDVHEWLGLLEQSPLVAVVSDREGIDDKKPLRLAGTLLYLDRYWCEEQQVAADLAARSSGGLQGGGRIEGVDTGVLAEGLQRLFTGTEPDLQRLAAAAAILRRFSVVAGGPGTGKTTTVARILALLDEQASATRSPFPLVALAAPTGKAAARLEEAVHEEAAALDVSAETRERLRSTSASTLHRLLGWRPDSQNRFRHNRRNRLPHDVVIIDETSMVSLSLMARLVEAVRSSARLVLVGDPEQLASVEAGAVLGDIVGPATTGLLIQPEARQELARVTAQHVPAVDPPAGSRVGDGIVVLRQVHRFGGGIAELAESVRGGDGDAALHVLTSERDDVRWIPVDIAGPGAQGPLSAVRALVIDAARRVIEPARAGEAKSAIEALNGFRVLCAHRLGPYGVTTWMEKVEMWLASSIEGFANEGVWYPGRPLLVTQNDYSLRLFNGDTGVVVAASDNRVAAVFERRDELLEFSPTRLAAVDTVYAMTIHKSQGSQFGTVAVLLPDPSSAILTRELLYTAVTRARRQLVVAGTEEAVRAAVARPIARASGLRHALWEPLPQPGNDG